MKDAPQLLQAMVRDQQGQRGAYSPGPYWQGYSRRIVAAIEADGLAGFRSNPRVGKGYADTATLDPLDLLRPGMAGTILRRAMSVPLVRRKIAGRCTALARAYFSQMQRYQDAYCDLVLSDWLADLRARYDLPETLHGDPDRVVTIGESRIGASYLDAFLWIDGWSRNLALDGVRTGMEIGGGFGALTHSLLGMHPGIRKWVYLDLPPILYVGTQYLKHFFGDAVRDYEATRHQERLTFSDDDRLEILCIAPWQIEALAGPVELFVNTSSFQEMPRDTVANYAQHFARLAAEHRQAALYVYQSAPSARTLTVEDVSAVFEEHAGMRLRQVPQDHVLPTRQGHLLVGHDRP